MLRSHAEMEREVSALATKYQALIETEARKVLAKHKRLKSFTASMGAIGFYGDALHSLEYDDLPKAAQLVCDMADDYQDTFGSPGTDIQTTFVDPMRDPPRRDRHGTRY